ncbi:MAG: type II CAAX endopeptidase family protein [Chloroflexota bacterium]|nr:type II CAAX endopeptidase family protein [Chloroflexota bacterium]
MTFVKNILWNKKEARLRAGWRLMIQSIILFGILFLVQVIPMVAFDSTADLPEVASLEIILAPMTLLGFLLAVWLSGRFLDRRRFADFGFNFSPSWWADFGFGLALGALLMAGIFLVELAAGWVTVVGTFESGIAGVDFPVAILLPLVIFICVGIYEELWSRGYHLKNLAEGLNFQPLGPKGAIVLAALSSSMLFGLLHAGNPNATVVSTLNIALAGIFLGMGYLLTGELAIPIGLHISWNFFQGNVFGFPVSGIYAGATVIAIQQGGPDLWTGGPFGPEAGLAGIVATVVGSLLTIGWVRLRNGDGKVCLHEQLVRPDLLPRKRDQA